MAIEPGNVLDIALSLPKCDRAHLAFRLLQSLKPPAVLRDEDPQFHDELERRVGAYESGQISAADWDTVSERLQKALSSRKSS